MINFVFKKVTHHYIINDRKKKKNRLKKIQVLFLEKYIIFPIARFFSKLNPRFERTLYLEYSYALERLLGIVLFVCQRDA